MKLVVIALKVQVNVPLLVLENRVKNMVHTAHLVNTAVALDGPACGLNCIGQVCLSDNNCAPKEICCGLSDGNKGTCGRFCAGESCKNDGHYGSVEYCCGGNATCASKCAKQMCTRRHHCGTGEFCCGNAPSYLRKCGKSCINIIYLANITVIAVR